MIGIILFLYGLITNTTFIKIQPQQITPAIMKIYIFLHLLIIL